MDIVRNILDKPLGLKDPQISLGTFDGLHRGHVSILERLKQRAASAGVPAVAVTYHPHPQRVLADNSKAPKLLSTMPERLKRFRELGMDAVVVIPFDRPFSRWTAEDFVRTILLEQLRSGGVVVGYDHAFGHDRRGKTDLLQAELSHHGIPVEVVPPVKDAGGPIKSSRIRRLLASGELDTANLLLGYAYSFTGEVVRGDRRGATLGFPTANINIPDEKQLPAQAIYGAQAHLGDESYPALVHIGPRPTLHEQEMRVEAHLLDFPSRDLYGETISITPEVHLREVEGFDSLPALAAQLEKDRKEFIAYRNRKRKENARASQ